MDPICRQNQLRTIGNLAAMRRICHPGSDRCERAAWASGASRGVAGPMSAIWAVPWFVTQDGPAHAYNAQILADSFDARAVPRSLHDLMEADPELDGAPHPGRAGRRIACLDR